MAHPDDEFTTRRETTLMNEVKMWLQDDFGYNGELED
jgi:hypothetical protein